MKILLIGEFSRLHNSLKEGLIFLGHEVKIVAAGDNFKRYPVDYSIHAKFFLNFWGPRKIKNIVYRIIGFDLAKTERAVRFYFLLPQLKNFDVVQLINSDALDTHPKLELQLFKILYRQNKRMALLVCGDETPVNEYLLRNELRYSVLTPYLLDRSKQKEFAYSLKYVTPKYRRLFRWIEKNASAIIVSDLDYKIPMDRMGYNTLLIPNPINTDIIQYKEIVSKNRIIIFLGINKLSYNKKGIPYFEEALDIIKEKYANRVEVIVSENVPYNEYILSYNNAHIVLDQVYGFDQGYNALEAMAKGKVVFTGAENEFYEYYKLTEPIAVNALPDVDYLIERLSFLIENPSEIAAIGNRARKFIELEHDYIIIAKKYLKTWEA